jgi:hypothetical protein
MLFRGGGDSPRVLLSEILTHIRHKTTNGIIKYIDRSKKMLEYATEQGILNEQMNAAIMAFNTELLRQNYLLCQF